MNVEAKLCKPPLKNPGDYHFVTKRFRDPVTGVVTYPVTGMVYVCPSGCGDSRALNFEDNGLPKHTWDGNKTAPTLTPAISAPAGCGYHGWLIAGTFTDSEDF